MKYNLALGIIFIVVFLFWGCSVIQSPTEQAHDIEVEGQPIDVMNALISFCSANGLQIIENDRSTGVLVADLIQNDPSNAVYVEGETTRLRFRVQTKDESHAVVSVFILGKTSTGEKAIRVSEERVQTIIKSIREKITKKQ